MKARVDLAAGIAAGRVAIGVGALLAPAKVLAPVGLDAAANQQLPYLSRIAGARDVALGLTTLATSGPGRRQLVLAGLAVDAADAVSGLVAARNGEIDRRSAALLSGAAVAAVAGGLAHLLMSRGDTQ